MTAADPLRLVRFTVGETAARRAGHFAALLVCHGAGVVHAPAHTSAGR